MINLTEIPIDRSFIAVYQRGDEIYSDKFKWFRGKLHVLSGVDGDFEYVETPIENAKKYFEEYKAVYLVAD